MLTCNALIPMDRDQIDAMAPYCTRLIEMGVVPQPAVAVPRPARWDTDSVCHVLRNAILSVEKASWWNTVKRHRDGHPVTRDLDQSVMANFEGGRLDAFMPEGAPEYRYPFCHDVSNKEADQAPMTLEQAVDAAAQAAEDVGRAVNAVPDVQERIRLLRVWTAAAAAFLRSM